MIADENALETFTIRRTTPTWRTRPTFAQLAAAIMARLHKRSEEREPDAFATEMPFLTDAWPHN